MGVDPHDTHTLPFAPIVARQPRNCADRLTVIAAQDERKKTRFTTRFYSIGEQSTRAEDSRQEPGAGVATVGRRFRRGNLQCSHFDYRVTHGPQLRDQAGDMNRAGPHIGAATAGSQI